MMVPGAERQLQLGDEERIDERLARRAHDLEERLAKLGAPGIQRPKDLLEFVNNLKHKSVGGQTLCCYARRFSPVYRLPPSTKRRIAPQLSSLFIALRVGCRTPGLSALPSSLRRRFAAH